MNIRRKQASVRERCRGAAGRRGADARPAWEPFASVRKFREHAIIHINQSLVLTMGVERRWLFAQISRLFVRERGEREQLAKSGLIDLTERCRSPRPCHTVLLIITYA